MMRVLQTIQKKTLNLHHVKIKHEAGSWALKAGRVPGGRVPGGTGTPNFSSKTATMKYGL